MTTSRPSLTFWSHSCIDERTNTQKNTKVTFLVDINYMRILRIEGNFPLQISYRLYVKNISYQIYSGYICRNRTFHQRPAAAYQPEETRARKTIERQSGSELVSQSAIDK